MKSDAKYSEKARKIGDNQRRAVMYGGFMHKHASLLGHADVASLSLTRYSQLTSPSHPPRERTTDKRREIKEDSKI